MPEAGTNRQIALAPWQEEVEEAEEEEVRAGLVSANIRGNGPSAILDSDRKVR